jgi:hypothetical protein
MRSLSGKLGQRSTPFPQSELGSGQITSKALGQITGAITSSDASPRLAFCHFGPRDGEVKPNYLNLDRDFAVDELAVVYPILNAIFDPIPIVAEETDCFVRGRIGKPHATCATPPIAHDLEVNPAVCGFPSWAEEKFCAHNILSA